MSARSLAQEPARVEHVRDEAELEARVRAGSRAARACARRVAAPGPRRRAPRRETIELLVVELDGEARRGAPAPCPGTRSPRPSPAPTARAGSARGTAPRSRRGRAARRALERRQAGFPPRFEQRLVVGEVKEGVAPVEEDRVEHDVPGYSLADRVRRGLVRKILYALLALGPLTIARRPVHRCRRHRALRAGGRRR